MPGGTRKVLQDWLRHVDGLKEVRPQTDEEDDEVHDGFEEEFLRLKDESSRFGNEGAYASLAGKLECNRRKNRYKDILPYDLSRVKLRELEGVAGSDYINASFIKGASGTQEYIAAQAPLPHTLNDFWRMIIEQGVVIIVMAANEREGIKVKCERYWPEEVGEEKTFGDISVSLLNEEWHNNYFVERLMCAKWQPSAPGQHAGSGRHTSQQLLQQEPFERLIVQYHYVAWPDHGIPSPNASIPDFIERVRCRQRELLGADDGTPAPVLVHCSAGCGRTGTVIAIDYVQQLFDTRKRNRANPEFLADFSLFNLALDLRKQRNAMIQTKDQYVVVYNAVAELVRDALSELGGGAGSRGTKAVTHPSSKSGPSFAASSGAAARKTQEPEAGLNEMEDLIANLSQPLPACGTGRLQLGQQPVQPTSPKGRTAVAAAASADAPASLPSSASHEPPALLLQQQQASSAGGGESCNATGNSPAWPRATAPKSSSEAGQQGPAAAAAASVAAAAAGRAAAGRPAERSVAAYENVPPVLMRPPRSKSLRLHSLSGGGQATDTVPTPRSVQQQPTTQQLDSEAAAALEQDRAALATAAAAGAAVSAKSKPLSPPTPSHGLVADAAGGSTSWCHVTSGISPGSPSSKRQQQQPGTAVGTCTSPAQGLGTGGGSSSSGSVVTWHKAYDVSTAALAASAAVSSKAWPLPSVRPAVGGSSLKLLRAHPQQLISPLTRYASDPPPAASGVQHSLLAQPCQSAPAQLPQQQPSIAASPTLMPAANQRANHPVTLLDSLTSASAEGASSAPKMLPNPQAAAAAAAAQLKASASIGAVATSSGNVGGGEAVASNSPLPGASPDRFSAASSSVYAELQPRKHPPGCRPLPALPGASDGGPPEPSSASSSTPRTREAASSEYAYVDLYSVNKWSLQHIARGCPPTEGAVSEASSYSVVGDDSEEDATPVVPPKTIDAHFTYDAHELQPDSLEPESGEAGAHRSGSSPSPGPPPKTRQLGAVAADMANLPNKMKGLFQPSKKPSVSEPPAAFRANSSFKEDVVYHGVNISYPNVVGKPKGPKGMPLQWKQPSGDSLPFPRST